MLKALVLPAAFALVSAAPMNGTVNAEMPPVRFQGNTAAIVVFTDRAGIDEACGVAPVGYHIIACTKSMDGAPVIFMPNACPFGDKEFYAKIACHEAGHVAGWSGNHEQ